MHRLALVLLALGLAMPGAAAQGDANWPDKPFRVVVPFPAGSLTDITMRILQQQIGSRLGQQLVIDNRSGASGNIGADALAKSPGDGYNFGLATNSTHAVATALNPRLPYDPIKDFALVSLIGDSPYVLITSPSLPANSVQELIALAKAKPGALNYASAGPTSLAHLAGALFAQMAGVKITEVPYRSSAQSVLDTSEGRIEMQFGTMAPVLPQVRAGKVKALPDVPTLAESGLPGYEASLWLAMVAPAATPPAIVARMGHELKEVLAQAD